LAVFSQKNWIFQRSRRHVFNAAIILPMEDGSRFLLGIFTSVGELKELKKAVWAPPYSLRNVFITVSIKEIMINNHNF
jgi:hypothetical protein